MNNEKTTTELTLSELQTYLKDISKKYHLIIFKTLWCGECIMTFPIFERIKASNHFPNVNFHSIDVDKFQIWKDDNNNLFNIIEVPTMIFFENEIEIMRVTGFISEKKLIEFIENSLTKVK